MYKNPFIKWNCWFFFHISFHFKILIRVCLTQILCVKTIFLFLQSFRNTTTELVELVNSNYNRTCKPYESDFTSIKSDP